MHNFKAGRYHILEYAAVREKSGDLGALDPQVVHFSKPVWQKRCNSRRSCLYPGMWHKKEGENRRERRGTRKKKTLHWAGGFSGRSKTGIFFANYIFIIFLSSFYEANKEVMT